MFTYYRLVTCCCRNRYGLSPLGLAAAHGCNEVVTTLLAVKRSGDEEETEGGGEWGTALVEAAEAGHVSTLALLLRTQVQNGGRGTEVYGGWARTSCVLAWTMAWLLCR